MIIPANLLRRMDPAARAQYDKAGWLPEETLAKASKALERQEHAIVCNWLSLHQIEFIHAWTARRVRDLPPGWPDFTLFYGKGQLLIEMKVQGGRLSKEQIDRHAGLASNGTVVVITGSASNAIALIKAWLSTFGSQVP
jgi:hypothetical protein